MRGFIIKSLAGLALTAGLAVGAGGIAGADGYRTCGVQATVWINDGNPGTHHAHTTFVWVFNNGRWFYESIACDNPPPSGLSPI